MTKNTKKSEKEYSLAFHPVTVGILWAIGMVPIILFASVVGWDIVGALFISGGFIFVFLYMYICTGRWLDWEDPWSYHTRILRENGVYSDRPAYDHEADVYNSGRQPERHYYR